jgi:hypothetical protein
VLKKGLSIFFFLLFHFVITAQEKQKDSTSNQQAEMDPIHEMTKRELLKLEEEAKDSLHFSTVQDTVSSDTLSKKEIRQFKRQQKRDSIAKIAVDIDPLSPAKAAFYSAILPGLGQIYNKSYWKLPFVYGAIGTGAYFYIENTNNYNRYRDAYKRRLAGFYDDEFYDINGDGISPGSPDVSDDALRDAQEFYQRNRDLSLLITIGLYVLNIVDANVDAHLKQFNVNENISLKPYIEQNQLNYNPNYGLSLSLDF